MKTLIHASEKKNSQSFHKSDDAREDTDAIKQKTDLPLQKNFGVVDLWKIRNMKKYFNYN